MSAISQRFQSNATGALLVMAHLAFGGMNTMQVRAIIEDAFCVFQQPQREEELTVDGLDSEYVVKNYLGLTREQVAVRGQRGGYYLEDLSYMQPRAVGYYLPVIMLYIMDNCDDDVVWIYLGGYLKPRDDGKIWWNLEALGARPHQAIGVWAEWLAWEFLERDADIEAIQNAERIAAYFKRAEPSGAPNGGPATPVGDTGVTEGPPSVT